MCGHGGLGDGEGVCVQKYGVGCASTLNYLCVSERVVDESYVGGRQQFVRIVCQRLEVRYKARKAEGCSERESVCALQYA